MPQVPVRHLAPVRCSAWVQGRALRGRWETGPSGCLIRLTPDEALAEPDAAAPQQAVDPLELDAVAPPAPGVAAWEAASAQRRRQALPARWRGWPATRCRIWSSEPSAPMAG